ncbi:MAG: hypothetical protein SF053_18565, partial [Bacteroidia bacterium]|nr:hypothetical protein [Bacteroidia bacterium]
PATCGAVRPIRSPARCAASWAGAFLSARHAFLYWWRPRYLRGGPAHQVPGQMRSVLGRGLPECQT